MIIENLFDLQKWINENSILYFNAEEFKCPCCGKVKIETELIEKLDNLRHIYGKPIKINSGYRCPKHNKEIGGSPTSSHLKGLAVDIDIYTSKGRYEILELVFKNSLFDRIGVAKTFIHLDIDKKKVNKVMWLY